MKQIPVRICNETDWEMVSNKSVFDSQTASSQTDSALSFSDRDKSNSALSYGSDTDEDIDLCDIKPTVTEFFVKIESEISEPVVCKTEVPDLSTYDNVFTRRPRVVLQRIEFPLKVPKPEPVSDAELSPVNNFPSSEMDLIEDSITEEKTNISFEVEEEKFLGDVSSISNSESPTVEECLTRKRKKVRKKNLTISQMYEIIQNDKGFFSRKKQWMTKKVLRQLPSKDKIFLSNILKKFMRRKKLKKRK